MEPSNYAVEAQVESTHWWFVGRRILFRGLILGLGLDPGVPVLDVGSSTGTNLRLLRDMGFRNVAGIDSSQESIRYCRAKGLGEVQEGDIRDLRFEDDRFSLILATDVIEHVEDDLRALQEIRRVLRHDGRALITVPAFRSLWGLQDDVSHHKRRYRKSEFLEKMAEAGLEAEVSFYFNYVLFLPIWAARRAMRIYKPRIASENELNRPFMNRILTWIFALDARTAPKLRPPFGVSILVVARKTRQDAERRLG